MVMEKVGTPPLLYLCINALLCGITIFFFWLLREKKIFTSRFHFDLRLREAASLLYDGGEMIGGGGGGGEGNISEQIIIQL